MLNDGVNLVSYEDNRATLIAVKPMNQISNRVLMVQVKREKSFISKQHLGVIRESLGYAQSLLFAP